MRGLQVYLDQRRGVIDPERLDDSQKPGAGTPPNQDRSVREADGF